MADLREMRGGLVVTATILRETAAALAAGQPVDPEHLYAAARAADEVSGHRPHQCVARPGRRCTSRGVVRVGGVAACAHCGTRLLAGSPGVEVVPLVGEDPEGVVAVVRWAKGLVRDHEAGVGRLGHSCYLCGTGRS